MTTYDLNCESVHCPGNLILAYDVPSAYAHDHGTIDRGLAEVGEGGKGVEEAEVLDHVHATAGLHGGLERWQ